MLTWGKPWTRRWSGDAAAASPRVRCRSPSRRVLSGREGALGRRYDIAADVSPPASKLRDVLRRTPILVGPFDDRFTLDAVGEGAQISRRGQTTLKIQGAGISSGSQSSQGAPRRRRPQPYASSCGGGRGEAARKRRKGKPCGRGRFDRRHATFVLRAIFPLRRRAGGS